MTATTVEVKAWTTCSICWEKRCENPIGSPLPWVRDILRIVNPSLVPLAFVGHGVGRQRHEVGLACAAQVFKDHMTCPLCREPLAPPTEVVIFGKRSPIWKKSRDRKGRKIGIDCAGMSVEQVKKLKMGPIPLSVFFSLKDS